MWGVPMAYPSGSALLYLSRSSRLKPRTQIDPRFETRSLSENAVYNFADSRADAWLPPKLPFL
jgi:hypothetical protein